PDGQHATAPAGGLAPAPSHIPTLAHVGMCICRRNLLAIQQLHRPFGVTYPHAHIATGGGTVPHPPRPARCSDSAPRPLIVAGHERPGYNATSPCRRHLAAITARRGSPNPA